jgi:peptidoglycan hydrolase-like protein with peptidoglycan-binding domain
MPLEIPTVVPVVHGLLALGSRGPDVRVVQAALNRANSTPRLQCDGVFGINTDTALRAFQRANKLKADGIVGPATAAALGLGYAGRPMAPPLPTPSPSRPSSSLETPKIPGKPDQNAVAPLVEAIVQGFEAIQRGVIQTVLAIAELPSAVASEIRSRLSGPFQAAMQALRGCIHSAAANVAAAANIITATLRSVVRGVMDAMSEVAGLIGRLPDLLGLNAVADKIRAIVRGFQSAVNSAIDVVVKTLGGVGASVAQAIAFIIGVLRAAAAA